MTTATDIKEHPILFNGAMVRAILDGTKTQTRRVIKLPADAEQVQYWSTPSGRSEPGFAEPGVNYWTTNPSGNHIDPCPYGQPGDRLWVRETFAPCRLSRGPDDEYTSVAEPRHIAPHRSKCDLGEQHIAYKADGFDAFAGSWRPNIHMPRWACRILLEVTDVRVQRVQDISEEDAMAEGVRPEDVATYPHYSSGAVIGAFAELWDSINAKRGYPWESNPWVWAVTFKRIEM